MMNISDGAILFIACILSFGVGYITGAFRVTRFVSRELSKVETELVRHREGLEQFYSKLGEGNEKPL
jgi:hypothetical protein